METSFSTELRTLLNTTSSIQVRLLELAEFEKQWKSIFIGLTEEFGPDVKINVSNQLLLNTFRYDKFHIVCDDLLSLIENETQGEFSVSRKAAANLYIKSISEYVNQEKTKQYEVFDIGDEQTERSSESDRGLLERIFATERRNSHLEDYKILFGTNSTSEEKWEFLKDKLISLSRRIKGLRNLFSHRNQLAIQKKYAANWDDLEIEKFEDWFNEFFALVQKMALICDGIYYRGMIAGFQSTVSDQLDLILFGTIDRCSHLFGEKSPGASYQKAREEFYASREFVALVVSKGSPKAPGSAD